MAGLEDATDEELLTIAEQYPAEFAPESVDRWEAYFEALEEKHLEAGFERAVKAIDIDAELFAWLVAPFVSRMTEETLLDVLDNLSRTLPESKFEKVIESASTFAAVADTRRTVQSRYEALLRGVPDAMRRGIELQFEDVPTDFRREWLHGWVTEYRSSVSYLTRCALLEFDQNPREDVYIWAYGIPIQPVEPTPEMVSMLRDLYEETQTYYEDRDEPLELYKGTAFERTIASSVESWTDDERVADEYDGHSVYEQKIDSESVLFSYAVLMERANVYTSQAKNTFIGDSEYVVFGGGVK